jgi:hypothetical protein
MNGKKTSFMNVVKFALNNVDVSTSHTTKMPTLLEDESLIAEEEEENEGFVMKNSEVKDAKDLPAKPFLKTIGRSYSMDPNVGKPSYEHPTRRVRSTSNISSDKISISDRYFLKKLRAELRMSLDLEDNRVDTDKYMYGAMYACIGMILWKHKWIAIILIIPIAYYYMKQFSSYFIIGNTIFGQCHKITQRINSWCRERHQALIPVNIRGLFKVIIIVDRKMSQILRESVDSVVTTAVILGLIIFVICTSIFITIQVRYTLYFQLFLCICSIFVFPMQAILLHKFNKIMSRFKLFCTMHLSNV